ncbi:Nif3-like dinuclear metal center hexameric protein [Halorubrum sp. Atlit-8R]|uniref:Nif3-like dinuclear metal center hexameric protein n=1 Tax=unclassified Halorubrum TaxID=2642239 RepID=UPI000EF26E16|nr:MULTISPECIES: Nif3-like dinuclear metal center hexameric protein [unclassified Halorubrum]RLM70788.1 Nif3-like dinuclear metal center hexameric protein [Halorubrum sp. Atlit-9R]RLM71656.1 Nif3-like dinuclear metal center hexameric protein [Halorubrum sp. Atlit-9R]RLM83059.1 Nif3-like dinuclear metal center hexameric protein [Halorubrum sp. Atlit-8R]
MKLSEYVERLDDRLDTAAYADVDASANGLQVGPEAAEIERVAFAVDAARATIEAAADSDADALVVHHGLSWGGIERVTGRVHDRIAALVEHDIALYVSHLPLDGHQELGNAAGVADAVGLADRDPFGEMGPVTIGTIGEAAEPRSAAAIRETLDGFEGQPDGEPSPTRVLDFGPDEIERVAVVTGSGVDWLDEAVAAGADALITGEGKQQAYHDAREAGLTVFLAGHYATETFGVRALQSLTDDWGVETTYLPHPTGL